MENTNCLRYKVDRWNSMRLALSFMQAGGSKRSCKWNRMAQVPSVEGITKPPRVLFFDLGYLLTKGGNRADQKVKNIMGWESLPGGRAPSLQMENYSEDAILQRARKSQKG